MLSQTPGDREGNHKIFCRTVGWLAKSFSGFVTNEALGQPEFFSTWELASSPEVVVLVDKKREKRQTQDCGLFASRRL